MTLYTFIDFVWGLSFPVSLSLSIAFIFNLVLIRKLPQNEYFITSKLRSAVMDMDLKDKGIIDVAICSFPLAFSS